MNLKSTTTKGFNLWIINSLMASWGVRLTWLDCKTVIGAYCSYFEVKKEFYRHAIEKIYRAWSLHSKLLVRLDVQCNRYWPCEIKATTKVIAIIGRGNMFPWEIATNQSVRTRKQISNHRFQCPEESELKLDLTTNVYFASCLFVSM